MELLGRRLLHVAVEDSRLRLHHLGKSPEGDTLAVGERAPLPPVDEVRISLNLREELRDEPALPDARDADECDELRRRLPLDALEGVDQQVALPLSPDERRLRLQLDAHDRPRLDGLPDGDRLGLPFRLDRLGIAIVDRLLGSPVGGLVDEDAVRGGGGLETRGGVHHVTGGHPLTGLGTRLEGYERLAGRDPNPDFELCLLPRPFADRERSAYCPLRIVLVCGRSTEEGHHSVADELLHRPPVALQLGAEPLVVGAKDRFDVLGIERFRARGEADEIGEQAGHDLSLFAGQWRRSTS